MKLLATMIFPILVSLFSTAQYAPGYYIDSAGNKVPGLLKYTFAENMSMNKSKGDCRLFYKQDSAAKSVKFTAKDIKGFVIGSDSFTVIHNFRPNGAFYYPVDFIRVLEIGKIKLLQYDAIAVSNIGVADSYYWLLEKDHKAQLVSSGNFRKLLETLMEDDPELVERIKNKEFKYKQLREVVVLYNKYMSEHS